MSNFGRGTKKITAKNRWATLVVFYKTQKMADTAEHKQQEVVTQEKQEVVHTDAPLPILLTVQQWIVKEIPQHDVHMEIKNVEEKPAEVHNHEKSSTVEKAPEAVHVQESTNIAKETAPETDKPTTTIVEEHVAAPVHTIAETVQTPTQEDPSKVAVTTKPEEVAEKIHEAPAQPSNSVAEQHEESKTINKDQHVEPAHTSEKEPTYVPFQQWIAHEIVVPKHEEKEVVEPKTEVKEAVDDPKVDHAPVHEVVQEKTTSVVQADAMLEKELEVKKQETAPKAVEIADSEAPLQVELANKDIKEQENTHSEVKPKVEEHVASTHGSDAHNIDDKHATPMVEEQVAKVEEVVAPTNTIVEEHVAAPDHLIESEKAQPQIQEEPVKEAPLQTLLPAEKILEVSTKNEIAEQVHDAPAQPSNSVAEHHVETKAESKDQHVESAHSSEKEPAFVPFQYWIAQEISAPSIAESKLKAEENAPSPREPVDSTPVSENIVEHTPIDAPVVEHKIVEEPVPAPTKKLELQESVVEANHDHLHNTEPEQKEIEQELIISQKKEQNTAHELPAMAESNENVSLPVIHEDPIVNDEPQHPAVPIISLHEQIEPEIPAIEKTDSLVTETDVSEQILPQVVTSQHWLALEVPPSEVVQVTPEAAIVAPQDVPSEKHEDSFVEENTLIEGTIESVSTSAIPTTIGEDENVIANADDNTAVFLPETIPSNIGEDEEVTTAKANDHVETNESILFEDNCATVEPTIIPPQPEPQQEPVAAIAKPQVAPVEEESEVYRKVGDEVHGKTYAQIYEYYCIKYKCKRNTQVASTLKGGRREFCKNGVVDMKLNFLGDRGVLPVLECVKRLNCTKFSVPHNGIRNAGARAITLVAKGHATLKSLDFSGNAISLGAANALLDLVRTNHIIVEIGLEKTRIDNEYKTRIAKYLTKNKQQ